MSGNKNDDGKLRMDLIPAEVLEALAKVLTEGAKAYGDNNWQEGIGFRRVYAATQRHLTAYRKGEYIDHDSGLPHLWHAFTELAFLIYYNDDRLYDRYVEFNDFTDEWNGKGVPCPAKSAKERLMGQLCCPVCGKDSPLEIEDYDSDAEEGWCEFMCLCKKCKRDFLVACSIEVESIKEVAHGS